MRWDAGPGASLRPIPATKASARPQVWGGLGHGHPAGCTWPSARLGPAAAPPWHPGSAQRRGHEPRRSRARPPSSFQASRLHPSPGPQHHQLHPPPRRPGPRSSPSGSHRTPLLRPPVPAAAAALAAAAGPGDGAGPPRFPHPAPRPGPPRPGPPRRGHTSGIGRGAPQAPPPDLPLARSFPRSRPVT